MVILRGCWLFQNAGDGRYLDCLLRGLDRCGDVSGWSIVSKGIIHSSSMYVDGLRGLEI